MIADQWQLWLIVVGVTTNLLLAVLLYRTMRPPASAAPAPVGSAADRDVVACPDCDAVNESEYRFCRECGGELPGAAPVADAGMDPITRMSR